MNLSATLPDATAEMPLPPVVADLQTPPRAAHPRAGHSRNLCPLCRASMRRWALNWRDQQVYPRDVDSGLIIRTAASFRDQCCHTDHEKYDALMAKLKALPTKASSLTMAIWFETERIKNLHCGKPPVGRTFLAWQVDCATARKAGNIQHSTFNAQHSKGGQ